jgi:hypothetical protein
MLDSIDTRRSSAGLVVVRLTLAQRRRPRRVADRRASRTTAASTGEMALDPDRLPALIAAGEHDALAQAPPSAGRPPLGSAGLLAGADDELDRLLKTVLAPFPLAHPQRLPMLQPHAAALLDEPSPGWRR